MLRLKLKNIRVMFSSFEKIPTAAKDIWSIINTTGSILHENNYAQVFFLGHNCMCPLNLTIHLELCSQEMSTCSEQIMSTDKYTSLVYTTQVNSTFRARLLASWEVISQVLFTSDQPKKNKMAFDGILSQIKLLIGLLVIQLVWYILKTIIHLSVSASSG